MLLRSVPPQSSEYQDTLFTLTWGVQDGVLISPFIYAHCSGNHMLVHWPLFGLSVCTCYISDCNTQIGYEYLLERKSERQQDFGLKLYSGNDGAGSVHPLRGNVMGMTGRTVITDQSCHLNL
jgi:hypothetical protein